MMAPAANGCKRLLSPGSVPWLQQLDPIPERVVHVDPVVTFKGFVGDRIESGCRALCREIWQTPHEKGWVRLPSRPEVRLNTQVNSNRTAPKPYAATHSEVRWLRLLDHAEDSDVEGSGDGLLARWHGQLDAIKTQELTHSRMVRSGGITPCRSPAARAVRIHAARGARASGRRCREVQRPVRRIVARIRWPL
jgi:hypothetical protein